MPTAPSRWTSRALLALLALLLLVPSAVLAEKMPYYGPPAPRNVKTLELVDPIDGHVFSWEVPIGTNALGGHDSDGCQYAKGEQTRRSAIATSPTTLFSAPVEAFDVPLTAEQKRTLMLMLSSLGAEVDSSRQLTATERFELAAAVAEHLDQSPHAIAELYLVGGWTVRDSIVGFLPGVRGAGDAWNKLQEVQALAREVTEPVPRTRALFDMARLAHRGGFVHERDDFLAKLDTFEDAGLGAQEKRAEFGRRVARENALLSSARGWYLKALEARAGDNTDRALARLLVADISRRLGEFDEARTQVEAVRLDRTASPEVAQQADDVLQALNAQSLVRMQMDEGTK